MAGANAWATPTGLWFVTRRRCLQTMVAASGWGVGLGLGVLGGLPLALAEVPASSGHRLRFTLTFVNPHQRHLGPQHFWCYLPAELMVGQSLKTIQVSMPHKVLSDQLGHRILALSFDAVTPLAQKVVSVTMEVSSRASAGPERLPDPQAWLAAERFIEVNAIPIRERAAQLRRPGVHATARAIYDWVQQHVRYAGYVADDLGALYALTNGSGDCTEYADLVVALARACGIPARMVGGYVIAGDAILRAQDYHNWAELYLDGSWQVLDAQKGNWLASREQYIVFRIYRDVAVNALGLAHRYRLVGELEVVL